MENSIPAANSSEHTDAADMPVTMAPSLSFSDLGLSDVLVKHLETIDFKTPTPIQAKMIPQLLEKPLKSRDFLALAPTGTGKTGAFGLPLIEIIDATITNTQALILCPTRELAMQVSAQLQSFGRQKQIRVVTIYGGASYQPQMEGVKRGAHIIVATPGRLVDFIKQKIVKLGKVKTVVLDEADEMVKMGFKEDLEAILSDTQSEGENPQTWLFSATMNPGVRRIAQSYLKSPGSVEIKKELQADSKVEQCYMAVQDRDKVEALVRYLQTNEDFYGLIFCQTKSETAEIARALNNKGYSSEAINGDKSQGDREKILALFRQRRIKVLVATDVAARGLDIKDLSHVVNFSMPWDVESYVHRIGRTARNGQTGIALSLISSREVRDLHRIQTTLRVKMSRVEIPSSKEMALYKLKNIQTEVMKAFADESLMKKAKELTESLNLEGELAEEAAKTTLAGFIAAFHKELLSQKDLASFSTDTRARATSGGGYRTSETSRDFDREPRRRPAYRSDRPRPSSSSSFRDDDRGASRDRGGFDDRRSESSSGGGGGGYRARRPAEGDAPRRSGGPGFRAPSAGGGRSPSSRRDEAPRRGR